MNSRSSLSVGAQVAQIVPDLFGEGGPSGFSQAEGLISTAEEAALIRAIDGVELRPFRFQGWLGKRLTASFGWRYDFEDASFSRAEPIPEWLLPLRDRAAAFARLPAERLVQALVTRYDPGAGIGWHRDRPVFEHVLGVSLGSPATLRLRRRRPGGFERFSANVTPRSIYRLSDAVRWEWEHSIAPMDVPRWSVTFRTLSPKGLALTAPS
jgi:DNA oxidative demethylase